MCCVAPGHMKVLICSSQDRQCWPILVCAQVLFVYHGYQHDFALGLSLLLGNILHEIKLDSSVKSGEFSNFKICRRFFCLPVFFVLSFLEELLKYLICGCDEGVFQVNVSVPGAWRNQAGSSSEPLLSKTSCGAAS